MIFIIKAQEKSKTKLKIGLQQKYPTICLLNLAWHPVVTQHYRLRSPRAIATQQPWGAEGVPVQGNDSPISVKMSSCLYVQFASYHHHIMEVPGQIQVIIHVLFLSQLHIGGAP